MQDKMDDYGNPLSEFELKRLENIRKNNELLRSLGLSVPKDPKIPKRVKVVQPKRKKKKSLKTGQSLFDASDSSSESSTDSDEDWVPGVTEETLKKRKMFQKFRPEFRPKRNETVGTNSSRKKNSLTECKNTQQQETVDDFEELGHIAEELDVDSSLFDDAPSDKVKHDTGARYPKRPRATPSNYREAEVPDDDHYLFCEECQELHYGDCPIHGPLESIPDTAATASAMTAARSSLPSCLEIRPSPILNAGLGVFAKSSIAKRVKFGPYKGRKVKIDDEQMDEDTSYMWEISKDGKFNHFVDGHNEEDSNWMRFVNCSRCEREQNLVAFQYRGQIYYRSYKDINPGAELLVWYGDKYANDLGIELEEMKNSTDQSYDRKSLLLLRCFCCC
ncbi:histone-lysine N-methyltransferase PRDM9-like [Nematostella vectensis]|uniref:histone-lysine N-methyltransferase PRDM9-like n=1 Tax=Nematostella vectensis TaxID=45351 RepID=UPI0020770A4D|nr:histone-lysine N-methyltransferase PRDM9-like [Nematostella vectensis]